MRERETRRRISTTRWASGLAILLILFPCLVFAVGRDGFVANIIQDGYQVKELSNKVSLPFYSEYQIRLKNTHDRKATAKVFIDGIPVSKLGDIVIPSNGQVNIERFLDRSLTEGKKFKFVPITHPEVDDPYSKDNGTIKVEFKLERKYEPNVLILPEKPYSRIPLPYSGTEWKIFTGTNGINTVSNTNISCSTTSAGATIGGGESYQIFTEIHLDMEDQVFTIELKIIGI